MIIYGTKLAGRIDEVPGIFYVATKFGHLWYVPLIPMGTQLIFEKTDSGWSGMPIRLSWRSMLLGWLRGLCAIGVVACAIVALINYADRGENWVAWAIGALGMAAVGIHSTWLSKAQRTATYERARELAETAGLNELGYAMIDLYFGKITEEEAQRIADAAVEKKRSAAS